MKRGTKKAMWVGGLVLGAIGLGTGIYFATRPKQKTTTLPPPPKTTTPTSGGGQPTTVTPTATPGIFAAFAPGKNVSWVQGPDSVSTMPLNRPMPSSIDQSTGTYV